MVRKGGLPITTFTYSVCMIHFIESWPDNLLLNSDCSANILENIIALQNIGRFERGTLANISKFHIPSLKPKSMFCELVLLVNYVFYSMYGGGVKILLVKG